MILNSRRLDLVDNWPNGVSLHPAARYGGDRGAARRRQRRKKSRRSPYFWALLANPFERGHSLYEGLISTARVILLGLCMDAIYQWIVLKIFYPEEAVIVAIALAFFLICCCAVLLIALRGGGAASKESE
jgi:hypothetical protein